LILVACCGDVGVGLGVAVVRRDGFDVVAGIAVQIFVVAFVFADDASISCDFGSDYLVGFCDGDAQLAFLVALYSESKDTLSEILLLLDSVIPCFSSFGEVRVESQ
jgi:hypothetical protein